MLHNIRSTIGEDYIRYLHWGTQIVINSRTLLCTDNVDDVYFSGKMRRVVGQFTPYSWTSFEWGYTKSFTNFVLVCFIIFLVSTGIYELLFVTFLFPYQWTLQELNVFYLKAILWVPPNHILNFYRELFYAFAGACAVHEGYTYLKSTWVERPCTVLMCWHMLYTYTCVHYIEIWPSCTNIADTVWSCLL